MGSVGSAGSVTRRALENGGWMRCNEAEIHFSCKLKEGPPGEVGCELGLGAQREEEEKGFGHEEKESFSCLLIHCLLLNWTCQP